LGCNDIFVKGSDKHGTKKTKINKKQTLTHSKDYEG
jgi:hypothetical protein